MKLLIQLVTWNGAKYIPYLFDSLKKQTFTDWAMIVLDNHSEDDTVAVAERMIAEHALPAQVAPLNKNIGFAAGHNTIFFGFWKKKRLPEYVLFLNQDMHLLPDCLEKLVLFLDEHREVCGVSPRLMRWHFSMIVSGFRQSLTDTIDSLGLRVLRNRRVIEYMAGESWTIIKKGISHVAKKYGEEGPINNTSTWMFGLSGALPMFRTKVLRAVSFLDATVFDESYHAYKEDVDLAFRLRSAGFHTAIVFDAVAYHDRSAAGLLDLSDTAAAENKKTQSAWACYNSYKNHLATLYKNEYWQNALLDFPHIFWYELKKFGWFLLFNPKVLAGIGDLWKARKALKEKRASITEARFLSWRQMRKWWV